MPFLTNHFSFLSLVSRKFFIFLLVFTIGSGSSLYAQDYSGFDEITVNIEVPRLGVYELPIAIKDQQAYLAIEPLFNLLQLKIEKTADNNIIAGYIIGPEKSYEINADSGQVKLQEKTLNLKDEDYIVTRTSFYLKSDLFQEIFALNTNFNFRSLNIKLTTELDLPVIKQKRLEKLRSNLNIVRGTVEPDTLLTRDYPFFRSGMLDWGIVTTQQTNSFNDNRFNLGIGTMFAGGETNVRLNYSTNVPFTSRNQFYQWRLIDNESKFFKQITAGKINTRATSSLFAPVVGVQFTNAPVLNRRSFGTYTLSDFTEPRWTVELYVNNVLIDYTEADASGFYSFEVPLMYGNTAVDLRFFGPYGEERNEQRFINIPYNFVPKNELEYTLSAGIVEDDRNRKFSRFNLNYGLSNTITFGGGIEYVSDIASGEFMPFLNTSARLTQNLLFTGEYTYGVKSEAILSYRNPRSFQVDLNYIKYEEDQRAINFNYLEERKLTVSAPIRSKLFNAYSRLSINQILMPTTEFTTAEFLLSGVLFGVSSNLTTYGLFNERAKEPTVYSSLSQTYRLPRQILFSPRLQYEFTSNEFTNLTVEFERPFIRRGFINLAYENNFRRNAHTFEIGLRYNFDFAQTAITSRIGNINSSFVQAAQGSLQYDNTVQNLLSKRRSSVGKAGISLFPFLDLNANGKKDEMEPAVPGLQLKNKSGYLTYNKNETIIRITDLQPYRNLFLEIDPTSLDNIAWKIENTTIEVETAPNQFRPIYIPVTVLGEASGFVYFEENDNQRGLGRIIINILNNKNEVVKSLLTEADGYFTYLGLPPGNYTAKLDDEQLEDLNFKAQPGNIPFTIEINEYGDIVDNLEFTLKENAPVEN